MPSPWNRTPRDARWEGTLEPIDGLSVGGRLTPPPGGRGRDAHGVWQSVSAWRKNPSIGQQRESPPADRTRRRARRWDLVANGVGFPDKLQCPSLKAGCHGKRKPSQEALRQ